MHGTCILGEEDGERGLARLWVPPQQFDHVVEVPIGVSNPKVNHLSGVWTASSLGPEALLVGVCELAVLHRLIILTPPPGPFTVLHPRVGRFSSYTLEEVVLRPWQVGGHIEGECLRIRRDGC